MGGRARAFVLFCGLISVSLLAGSAFADTAILKCNSQRDPIWVYDSLNSFNVDAKLKCGEGVEILARVKDFVKIRTQNGVEGYVPDVAFSNLPPTQSYRDSSHDVGVVAKQIQAKEIAKASAAAASLAPANVTYSRISPSAPAVIAIPAANASEKRLPAAAAVPSSSLPPASPAGVSTTVPTVAAPAPAKPAENPIVPLPSSSIAAASAPATTSNVAIATTSPAAIRPTGDSNGNHDLAPVRDRADLTCQSYFSAYGLTPGQTKWIAQNREKSFSNICPAPDPSKVNFVIIFTHDVDFFGASMPEPVHKANGFSDFTPMTTIDTALIPESQADKARREYVWVFQFEQGTFDPGDFSPNRQYQFSKMETGSLGTKASLKTVEDAFRYVAAGR